MLSIVTYLTVLKNYTLRVTKAKDKSILSLFKEASKKKLIYKGCSPEAQEVGPNPLADRGRGSGSAPPW